METGLGKEIQRRAEIFGKDIATLVETAMREALTTAMGRNGAGSVVTLPSVVKRNVTDEELLQQIRSLPGQRMEQISAALGVPSVSLKPAIRRLVDGKRVATRGRRRGMTYTAR